MTIEVKQLVIKSSVNDGDRSSRQQTESAIDLEAFRKELLAECKLIVSESLNKVRER
ncbi:MAG: hypothetical protein ACI95C_001131 [Pseudohongiellaceae bacterium]|jgi:hypothetical protein